jgi:epoxyqueuosine reductase
VADSIPEDVANKIGNRIFGCDDCLDACPYNMNASPTDERAFQPSLLTLAPDLRKLERLTEAEFASTFRQSPIRRAKHSGFMRNVSLARSKEQAPGAVR